MLIWIEEEAHKYLAVCEQIFFSFFFDNMIDVWSLSAIELYGRESRGQCEVDFEGDTCTIILNVRNPKTLCCTYKENTLSLDCNVLLCCDSLLCSQSMSIKNHVDLSCELQNRDKDRLYHYVINQKAI